MAQVIPIHRARFSVGQLIRHRLFAYRGVIFDVDASFQLSDEWYEAVARSRPPKDRPWYHVLVDGSDSTTYVAERNLEADSGGAPIQHPLLEEYFTRFENGRYLREQQ
jgi:heat shock protein HspQ